MFPHARNSLRRWSASEQGSKKVPIPISVSLHNVMAAPAASAPLPSQDDSPISSSVDKWFRPNHEIRLLPLLKLEVLADQDGDDNGGSSDQDGVDSSDEIPDDANDGNYRVVYTSPALVRSVQPSWEHLDERIDLPEEWWRRSGIYRTMRLRITQILSFEEESQKEEKTENDETSSSGTANSNNVFLEIPLYPSKLERLHRDDVPPSLPPNACFVHFSDGSTRCSRNLFAILLKSQLTEPAPVEDFSRFEDDVFRTLDGVPETPETSRQRAESISALLEPQDLNSRLIDEFDGSDDNEEPTNVPFEETEDNVDKADTQTERLRLLAIIAREENQLEDEVTNLREEQAALEAMLQEANDIEGQIQLIAAETKKQTAELNKDIFLAEAQHMKLLRELQTVYPITLDPKKGYLIRDLRLPVDIYTTTVPEEEISAALGFCCHLVFMISKYLSISLRYRLFCNSSRSAVQLDVNTFLPLFAARSVEREHLDHAMSLLGANVDCILMTHGIEFTPKSHILARLQRVYHQIIQGEIPLLENGIL